VVKVKPKESEPEAKKGSATVNPVTGKIEVKIAPFKQLTKQNLQDKISQIVEKVKKENEKQSGAFSDEVEINDYPQMARWRVTRKDALQAITEFTSAAITTRGSYYPPGKIITGGDRKLFLFIEGSDANSVKLAKTEILRILDETELSGPGEKGKYKV